MKSPKAIIATTVATAFFATGVAAAETSPKEEGAGFGIGAIVGGMVGGPVGIVIGAGLGTYFGNRVATAKEVVPLKQELAATRETGDDLENELQLVRVALHEHEVLTAELREREARLAGLQLQVLFTTGDANLDAETEMRMAELASIIKARPDLILELDGYADLRGEETYNLSLSRDRAEAVASALAGLGVDPGQMIIRAHGEAGGSAPEDDLDTLALDTLAFSRRVTLRFSETSGQVAENR